MKNYIKSLISLSGILAGGNYVCGTDFNQNVEPRVKEGRTIIATFNITGVYVNEDVQIINDVKKDAISSRSGIDRIDIYELSNNNVEKVKNMEYENKDGGITKNHRFNKQGVYMIYYYFQEGVKDMSYMFYDCFCLKSLDFSKFDATNVKNMSHMFDGCSALTSLDLSSFNTDSVTDMSRMFALCSSLTTLNLSSFNTNSVTNMYCMFYRCSSLTSLNLSKFNTKNVIKKDDLFGECSSLEKVKSEDKYINECYKEIINKNKKVKSEKKVNQNNPNPNSQNILDENQTISIV